MNLLYVLGPSLLIIIGGLISWLLKYRYEKLREVEEKLRFERRKIYIEILEPYITLFSLDEKNKIENAMKKILSTDYKKTAFELCLFGSDDVVISYNNLLKYGYESEKNEKRDNKKMITLFGNLLLEIRRSLGNKKTKLNETDMLQNMIKDIHNIL